MDHFDLGKLDQPGKDNHRQPVGEWLSRNFVWRVPVYQRHYAWDAAAESGPVHLFWGTVKKQTEARLDDPDKSLSPHYLGAVLVDNKTATNATDGVIRYDVVDGQQRLTTIQLAMLGLIQAAKDHNCAQRIQDDLSSYVFSDKEKYRPRLFPTNFDKKQFQAVLFDVYEIIFDFGKENVSKENARKSKIVETFNFFHKACNGLVKDSQRPPSEVFRAIMNTLIEGFDLVLIVLEETDDAQLVFQSLNNYAKPLTTFDLIRNYVFYRAAQIRPGLDEDLFGQEKWQQLEDPYWEGKADNRKIDWTTHIEAYVSRRLVANMKRRLLFNRNAIFSAYQEFAEGFCPNNGIATAETINEEIASLVKYTDIYQHLASPGRTSFDKVDFGVFHYDIWNNRDFYPTLFSIVGSDVSPEEKQKMVRLLESYVIRRGVCGLSPGNYNKYAVTLCENLKKKANFQNLSKALEDATAESVQFPDNEMVKESCLTMKFYGSPFQRHVLEEIEKSMHDVRVEKVVVEKGQLTIDHILPKKWENNEAWKSMMLGNDNSEFAALTVNPYLNTIGNLTLMSGKNNSIKSNHPFGAVKDLLSESTLKLNRNLAKEETWNVEKIAKRSQWFGEQICQIWPNIS